MQMTSVRDLHGNRVVTSIASLPPAREAVSRLADLPVEVVEVLEVVDVEQEHGDDSPGDRELRSLRALGEERGRRAGAQGL